MKVNHPGFDQVRPTGANAPASVENTEKTRPVAGPQPATDRVEWSATAREVASKLEELPEVRSDRVAALAQQVRRGEYSVPAGDVARKLLAFLRGELP
jgi:flagellar biosynthesis anti-sigma factor FlgM